MSKVASFRDLTIYAIVCIFVAYYVTLVPILVTGHWLNNLNPIRIVSANPLLLLALPWIFFPNRYFAFSYFGTVCLFMIVFNQISEGWIGANVIGKSGFGTYVLLWLETLLPAFVAPALLLYLLLNAEKFGPKIMRGWKPNEVQ